MPKIVVQVMPKEELLDPQGKAVAGALARLGKGHLSDVRVGKRFEITTSREPSAELMAEIKEISDDLLSNGVIEDVISIDVIDDGDDDSDLDVEHDEIDEDDERTIPIGAASDAQAEANERAAADGQGA